MNYLKLLPQIRNRCFFSLFTCTDFKIGNVGINPNSNIRPTRKRHRMALSATGSSCLHPDPVQVVFGWSTYFRTSRVFYAPGTKSDHCTKTSRRYNPSESGRRWQSVYKRPSQEVPVRYQSVTKETVFPKKSLMSVHINYLEQQTP